MTVTNILRAASFRSLGPRLFDSVGLAGLIEDVKACYNFKRASTVEETAQKPATFDSGKWEYHNRDIFIEQLIVSYVGVATTSIGATTRESTDDTDLFLDDLISWIGKTYRLDTRERLVRSYNSALEVVFDGPIMDHFAKLWVIGEQITGLIRHYGQKDCPRYEPEGFQLHFELSPSLVPSPVPFSLQRRIGTPYTENKFFSSAPLMTRDHVAVLENLEKALLSR